MKKEKLRKTFNGYVNYIEKYGYTESIEELVKNGSIGDCTMSRDAIINCMKFINAELDIRYGEFRCDEVYQSNFEGIYSESIKSEIEDLISDGEISTLKELLELELDSSELYTVGIIYCLDVIFGMKYDYRYLNQVKEPLKFMNTDIVTKVGAIDQLHKFITVDANCYPVTDFYKIHLEVSSESIYKLYTKMNVRKGKEANVAKYNIINPMVIDYYRNGLIYSLKYNTFTISNIVNIIDKYCELERSYFKRHPISVSEYLIRLEGILDTDEFYVGNRSDDYLEDLDGWLDNYVDMFSLKVKI